MEATISKYWTVPAAAREVGVLPQTLQSAVDKGKIPCERTADGKALVLLHDVRKWERTPRKRGPKPGNGKGA